MADSLFLRSTDLAALEAALAPFREDGYSFRRSGAGLEDVFIQLMESSEDNFPS